MQGSEQLPQQEQPALFRASIPSLAARGLEIPSPPSVEYQPTIFPASIASAEARGLAVADMSSQGAGGRRLAQQTQHAATRAAPVALSRQVATDAGDGDAIVIFPAADDRRVPHGRPQETKQTETAGAETALPVRQVATDAGDGEAIVIPAVVGGRRGPHRRRLQDPQGAGLFGASIPTAKERGLPGGEEVGEGS